MSTQLEKHTTGLAGEYLVAGMLSLQGHLASLTLKNFPLVDIFIQDVKTNEFKGIQVKSRRGNDIPVGGNGNAIDTLQDRIKYPFVFVKIGKNENVEYYIVPHKDLIRIIRDVDKRYKQRPRKKKISPDYPIAIKFSDIAEYKGKWELIWK